MDEKQKKIFLYLAIAVGVYALYVGAKRGQTAATTGPSAAPQGTGNDANNALASAIQALGQQQSDQASALAGVINQGEAANVGALNAISTAVTKAISDSNTAFATEFKHLEDALAGVQSKSDQLNAELDAAIGQNSIASCIQPNGGIDATCVKVKGGVYSGTKTQVLQGIIPQMFATCRKADGSYDYACAGKIIRAQQGGTAA